MDRLIILYGSQTGNAEDLAKRIGRMALGQGLDIQVSSIDDFPLNQLAKPNVILFVCSTTGHGQEPENMSKFFNFIRRRDLPASCLSNLKFAVYGLGDSSYAKFNFVSKMVYNRLKYLGAMDIQPLVASNEQHEFGCDGLIYPMLNDFWKISKEFVKQKHKTADCLDNFYEVNCFDDFDGLTTTDIFRDDFVKKYNISTGICVANDRVTHPDHFQDTRLIKLKALSTITYEPGDICTIYPCNSDANVELFIEGLELNPNQRFRIRKKLPGYMINYFYDYIPDGLTVRQLVKHYLDIQAIPKRSFFEFLWPICDDNLEKTKLQEFSTTDGQSDLYEYCTQTKRSILEVLLDFPKTRKCIKLRNLFDIIPPIKPRSFSIASSIRHNPNSIKLIVGVVKYKTRLRKIRLGLCSNYLASLEPIDYGTNPPINSQSSVRFRIFKSSFKLPRDPSRPILMIGPGLGIAPMISFIEERANQGFSSSKNLFYFGCRYRERDFYFRKELESFVESDCLTLRVAFSREANKQYVQDKLIEDAAIVKDLIEDQNVMIYVAGNSKLPEDVRKVLHSIIMPDGNADEVCEDDMIKVKNLESSGRIQYDCW